MSELRYLLDTNTVSDLMRNPQGRAAQRMAAVGVDKVAIGMVVACELRFGVARHSAHRLAQRLELILEHLSPLPLEPPADEHYADIRNALERAGMPIGPNDLLIAAQARALGLVLVTSNVRDFSRVQDLVVEDWLAMPGHETGG